MSKDIANVDSLSGKSFMALSGNTCIVSKLGPGGLSVKWKSKPTEKDISQFNFWMDNIVGPTEKEVLMGQKSKEHVEYAKFLAKMEKH